MHSWTPSACHRQHQGLLVIDPDPAGTSKGSTALSVSLVSPPRSWICLRSFLGGKGRSRCTAAAGGSISAGLYPSSHPSHPVGLCHPHCCNTAVLNSTAFYLWFPHDARGSAGEQGRDLWRRDKTQCVHKPEQRASPAAARQSCGCSVG